MWRVNAVVFATSFVGWSFWIEFAPPILATSPPHGTAGDEKHQVDVEHVQIQTQTQIMHPNFAKSQVHQHHHSSSVLSSIRNNPLLKDPQLELQASFVVPTYFLRFCYCVSRFFLLGLDFAELRSLPESAYETVDWLSFFPHTGS